MLPVTIITGFLGSGKTTLLNRLLQHEGLSNSLVIINEFGEVGVDHLLVSTPADNVRLLSNGCLCCEVKGDLVDTLTDVWRKRAGGDIPAFDRVLIETTGLADPVPIVQTVVTDTDLSRVYRLDTVVGVVDCVHALSQLIAHDEARKQAAVSDVLLLSKTDLAAPDTATEVEAAVRKINPGAECMTAVRGAVDPDLLFGRSMVGARAEGGYLERWLGLAKGGNAAAGGGNAYTQHTGDIRTFTAFYEGVVTMTGLLTWLSMLASFRGPQLLRVKGIVNVAGTPFVIHGVQTVIHEPVQLEQWPTPDQRTRIVFIVRGIERQALENTLAALSMPDPGADRRTIDPADYARFLEAARHFV